MGKLIIEICVGTSCHLLGSQDLIEAVEQLPPEKRENVEVKGVTCLQACGRGPNVRINGVVLTNMTPEHLVEIIHNSL